MKITKNLLVELHLARPIIRSGPFRGTYVQSYSQTVGRPKWLGTYEKELHPAWQRILATSPRVIFDIGGAEGYYACALLRALPHARLEAWEALEREQDLLRRNAARNGVSDRCTILGFCDQSAFVAAASRTPPDLVICDIEGGERDLLTATTLDLLRRATLVVETHGMDVFDGLLTLMRDTHECEVIHPQPRTVADWPLPPYLYATDTLKHWAIQEHRVMPTPWIIGWPREDNRAAPGSA
jgi:hypothetical protein